MEMCETAQPKFGSTSFGNWDIRYMLTPRMEDGKFHANAYYRGRADTRIAAVGDSLDDALSKIKSQIRQKVAKKAAESKPSTIDFNIQFTRLIEIPTAIRFRVEYDSTLLDVLSPEYFELFQEDLASEGYKQLYPRNKDLYAVVLSAAETKRYNLVNNARYILEEINQDEEKTTFELIYDSPVLHKDDKMRLSKPALTVGTWS